MPNFSSLGNWGSKAEIDYLKKICIPLTLQTPPAKTMLEQIASRV